jgi:hypothetical protein
VIHDTPTLPTLRCLSKLADCRPVVIVDSREQHPPAFHNLEHLRSVCFHEVGHYIVAKHFGKLGFITIDPTEGGPTDKMKGFKGSCYLPGTTTRFRKACICWAGPLIESAINEEDPMADLADGDWLGWFQTRTGDGSADSDTDRAGMFGHHQPYRAITTAARILVKHYSEVVATAACCMQPFLNIVGNRNRISWITSCPNHYEK